MVLGDSYLFLVVLCGSWWFWMFLVVLGDSWWLLAVLSGSCCSWWFLVVFGLSWWFLKVLDGSWWLMVVPFGSISFFSWTVLGGS